MRILSIEEAQNLYGTTELGAFFSNVDWQYPAVVPSYFLPKDSGAKVAVARALTSVFLERGPSVLWITNTKVWPSSGHMDLANRYRQSYGETRSVEQAPVHSFENNDRAAFVSMLCLGLFFVWDVEIMSLDRSTAVTLSHDEWLEYRFSRGSEHIVPIFEERLSPLLETRM